MLCLLGIVVFKLGLYSNLGFIDVGVCLFFILNWSVCVWEALNSRKPIGEKMNIFPRHLFFLFRFARLAANTFISQGVPVYLFSDITPTPFVVGFSFIFLYS